MKWGEAALWKEVDRRYDLKYFISIHLFFGHITVTQKVFSQVILFIDVLKFNAGKKHVL